MSTTREKILQKLNPRFLKMTPKLSAENGLFVNLDSNDSLEEGAKELLKRFWRNQDLCVKNKRSASQSNVEVTVTSAKYNEGNEICEILSERLKLPCSNEESICYEPVKNLQKLKMQLQEKMSAKWEEEYKKRVNENKLNKGHKELKRKKKKCSDEESSFDEDNDSDDCYEESEDTHGISEDDGCEGDVDEEEEIGDSIKNYPVSATGAEETLVENSSVGIELEDMESCSLPPAYQPGGGLLYGGSELTQCDDEDLLQKLISPSLKLCAPESPQCQGLNDSTPNGKETTATEECINSLSVRNKLFSQNPNESFDLNDAYEFCSGKFPDESSNSHMGTEASTAQAFSCASEDVQAVNQDEEEEEEDNESESEIDDDDDINDVCHNSECEGGNEPESSSKIRKNIMTFDDSDDEVENEPEVENCPEACKILSDDEEDKFNKAKKRRRNLQFSDEEDESDENEKEETEVEKEEEEEEEEVDDKDEERSILYDSEENEINPREFFEKEAELSGSEWSVDEDERGLDEFDVEEGDDDNLDHDQLRSQLEKIHLRQVLNEDARNVRLIQEILFEDGDLFSDGKGRSRKFKWKNLGKTFDENEEGGTKEEGNSSEDEGVEEEQQRKLRLEKELFLMEKKKNGEENSDEEIIQDFQSVKVTSVKSSIKISGTGYCKTAVDHAEIGKHVLLSKARGSFLTRNEKFLSRLAKVSSGISDNVLGPKHSKNFVFATRSPEKAEPNKNTACKRQVDGAETRDGRRDKKFKILTSDVDTGPSILDLLV